MLWQREGRRINFTHIPTGDLQARQFLLMNDTIASPCNQVKYYMLIATLAPTDTPSLLFESEQASKPLNG
jgi:hypothetical protein